jgi:ParB family chromosome partitioning protein
MTRTLRLDDVIVSDRLRTDLGELDGLTASIAINGLLQPLVVCHDNTLIAGRRRLEALRRLGVAEIDVRDVGDLGEVDRLRAELASDSESKPLAAIEHSRGITRLADAIEAEDGNFAPSAAGNSGPGRPPATRIIAERLGISERTLQRCRQHVAAVEKRPALAALSQAGAIDEALRLDRQAESEAEFQARADKRQREALAKYPELAQPAQQPTRANVVNAASALDSLPAQPRERVRQMVGSGALPVARVPDQVRAITPISTAKRLPKYPTKTDAEAMATLVIQEHQRKLNERQTELAKWIGWAQDTSPLEAAAAIATEDVAVTLEHLSDVLSWVESVKAALANRDAS